MSIKESCPKTEWHVDACGDCPFYHMGAHEYYDCYLNSDIDAGEFSPRKVAPEDCPLRTGAVLVSLNGAGKEKEYVDILSSVKVNEQFDDGTRTYTCCACSELTPIIDAGEELRTWVKSHICKE